MFTMPNHRAFQFVSHFLFQCLDKSAADDAFRHCWPVGDKRAEAEFRKIVTNWLADLAEQAEHEETVTPLPRIVPSLFMSPGGDKFIYVMFCFSRLVLVKVSIREDGIKPFQLSKAPQLNALPKDSPISYQNIMMFQQAQVIAERTQFVEEMKMLHDEHQKWIEITERFILAYRTALRRDKGCEEHLKEELESAAEEGTRLAGVGQWSRRFRSSATSHLNTGTPGSGVVSGRAAQKAVAERVRRFWRRIEETWASGESTIRLIADCLSDRSGENGENVWKLNGSQVKVRLPDVLVHRLEELSFNQHRQPMLDGDDSEDEDEIKMQQITAVDLYDDSRLNLQAVIRFISVALSIYSEHLASVVAHGSDFSTILENKISEMPGDCRYLNQMASKLVEAKFVLFFFSFYFYIYCYHF